MRFDTQSLASCFPHGSAKSDSQNGDQNPQCWQLGAVLADDWICMAYWLGKVELPPTKQNMLSKAPLWERLKDPLARWERLKDLKHELAQQLEMHCHQQQREEAGCRFQAWARSGYCPESSVMVCHSCSHSNQPFACPAKPAHPACACQLALALSLLGIESPRPSHTRRQKQKRPQAQVWPLSNPKAPVPASFPSIFAWTISFFSAGAMYMMSSSCKARLKP
jgi:hypothetical protein